MDSTYLSRSVGGGENPSSGERVSNREVRISNLSTAFQTMPTANSNNNRGPDSAALSTTHKATLLAASSHQSQVQKLEQQQQQVQQSRQAANSNSNGFAETAIASALRTTPATTTTTTAPLTSHTRHSQLTGLAAAAGGDAHAQHTGETDPRLLQRRSKSSSSSSSRSSSSSSSSSSSHRLHRRSKERRDMESAMQAPQTPAEWLDKAETQWFQEIQAVSQSSPVALERIGQELELKMYTNTYKTAWSAAGQCVDEQLKLPRTDDLTIDYLYLSSMYEELFSKVDLKSLLSSHSNGVMMSAKMCFALAQGTQLFRIRLIRENRGQDQLEYLESFAAKQLDAGARMATSTDAYYKLLNGVARANLAAGEVDLARGTELEDDCFLFKRYLNFAAAILQEAALELARDVAPMETEEAAPTRFSQSRIEHASAPTSSISVNNTGVTANMRSLGLASQLPELNSSQIAHLNDATSSNRTCTTTSTRNFSQLNTTATSTSSSASCSGSSSNSTCNMNVSMLTGTSTSTGFSHSLVRRTAGDSLLSSQPKVTPLGRLGTGLFHSSNTGSTGLMPVEAASSTGTSSQQLLPARRMVTLVPLAPPAAIPEPTPASAQSAAVRSDERVGLVPGTDLIVVNGVCYKRSETELGRGGSSIVYAVTTEDGQQRAIKIVNLENADEPTKKGYMNEIRILKRLAGCAGVIQLYDSQLDEATQKIYLVMQHGGRDFANYLKAVKKLPYMQVRHYWRQMLEAVKVAHDQRIVHLDLKPANFLLIDGRITLIDFGIAKALQNDKTHTEQDHQVGTINYMSPEAIQAANESGRLNLRPSSDIWSLGCILYLMTYAKLPFQTYSLPVRKLQAIVNRKEAIEFGPAEDPLVVAILKKCLQRDAKSRPTISQLLTHEFCTHTS
ncbi:serine/threonine-protein kinase mph1 [Capsaspora owczarzaki ATCC 30864]|uniref:serine/threonine-protein kinase mph1 n=1 Tax=Capsaspora owczarzaki (strain ATCC 30864) TaxID=595528 RepID=UPI000352396D|nr:serine/threonine-protein kinase mph1 [Capsaspora owczarzaki ATCC 30864]|eukprot:XP_004348217.2 serine/threonine-protein kinase mph1 [Capsaspora owczarzaki ATCC 30864]